MKQFSEPRNRSVRFPNTKSYAVDPVQLKEKYGDRYVLLAECPETQEVLKIKDFVDVPKNMQRYLPQGHPFFQLWRQIRRFTGSTADEYLGFRDSQVGTLLDIPVQMRVTAPENELVNEMRMYKKYGMIPRATLDQPGPCFAMNGTDHEENVNATLLGMIPSMIMHEVGTVVITNEHLDFFGVYDAFDPDKKRLRDLDIEIAISPDYECMAPESIAKGEGGKMLYGELTRMAGENKVQTPFIPQPTEKTEFPGADFFFVPNRKLWEKPKTYYVPQTTLEMLALMCTSNILTVWTFKGARSWKINMDVEYLSMIITIFNYIHVEFVMKDRPFPTNYFMNLPSTDHRHKVYTRMLQKTLDICSQAELYLDIPGDDTSRITLEVGVLSKDTYVEFPVLPDFLPDYHRLLIYGRRVFDNFTKIKWPLDWTSIPERMYNVQLLSTTQLTAFSMAMVVDIMETHNSKYHADIIEKPVVKQAGVEKTEVYMVAVYKLVCDLYGSPVFADKLNEVGFYRNIVVRAYAAYEFSASSMDNHPLTMKEYTAGEAAMAERAMDNFSIDAHHEVFTQHWINLVVADCRNLVSIMFEIDAPDAFFKASKITRHIDIVADNTNFYYNMTDVTESRDRPNLWQYQRLIAVLMMYTVVRENLFKIRNK